MISVWISVPPKRRDAAEPQNSQPRRKAAHWCLRWSRRVPSGRREPRRSPGAIWAAITRQGIVSPRRNSPSRGVAPTTTPNQRPRMSQPSMRTSTIELIAAQLPQILGMHDASEGSQVRSCSREPPGGNQTPGPGRSPRQHGHMRRSMTTATARPSPTGGVARQGSDPHRRALRDGAHREVECRDRGWNTPGSNLLVPMGKPIMLSPPFLASGTGDDCRGISRACGGLNRAGAFPCSLLWSKAAARSPRGQAP